MDIRIGGACYVVKLVLARPSRGLDASYQCMKCMRQQQDEESRRMTLKSGSIRKACYLVFPMLTLNVDFGRLCQCLTCERSTRLLSNITSCGDEFRLLDCIFDQWSSGYDQDESQEIFR